MRFEAQLAYRHLRSSLTQTLLTVAAVATAVTVIIFINSLLTGLQRRLINDLIGSLPHVTVKPPKSDPLPLAAITGPDAADGSKVTSIIEKQADQKQDIEQWELLERKLLTFPGVRVAAASVRGQGFVIRGQKRFGVTVSGGDPLKQEKVTNLQDDMIGGRWLDIGPEDVVIGYRLAEEAGVGIGDRIRILSSEGITATFTVAGIFDTGQNQVDLNQVFVNLRASQSLFAMRENVSSVNVKLEDPFRAQAAAKEMKEALPYEVESWMEEQAAFVNALQAQNGSRVMISAFALMASAFGIASVLIVSVVQKSKQIGILKSMGAKDKQIMTVFTLEGLGVAIAGAAVGSGLGYLLVTFLQGIRQVARTGKVDQLFPVIVDPVIFGVAVGLAMTATVVAAVLPARRAAKMNPVEVIRAN